MTQSSIQECTSDEALLNPSLVSALHRAFPEMRESLVIERAGKRRTSTQLFGIGGRPDEFGEQYATNCPFCGDKRGRMTVSHTYDPIVYPGRWHCYNEGCQRSAQHRGTLASRLQAVWREAKQAARTASLTNGYSQPSSPRQVTTVPVLEIDLPTGTIPIHQLPPSHPALNYLRGRNFDVERLWDDFWVGYCDGSRWPAPAIGARIIVPICTPPAIPGGKTKLIGWQARSIPEFTQDQHPDDKYLTMAGFRKNQHFYSAINGPVGDELFVVEGVTDAWRLGQSAIATLGKSVSTTQVEKLITIGQFKTRVFVAFDPDADTEKNQLASVLTDRFSSLGVTTQVHLLNLPDGRKDVGECSDEELAASRSRAIGQDSAERCVSSATASSSCLITGGQS